MHLQGLCSKLLKKKCDFYIKKKRKKKKTMVTDVALLDYDMQFVYLLGLGTFLCWNGENEMR